MARTKVRPTQLYDLSLGNISDEGSAAALNAPASGDAGASEVVKGNDSRLSDSRTPTTHSHTAGEITSGTISTARLGSGTASSATYLRGDQIWATVEGGGGSGLTAAQVMARTILGM